MDRVIVSSSVLLKKLSSFIENTTDEIVPVRVSAGHLHIADRKIECHCENEFEHSVNAEKNN
jgi:hypothetical protein